MRTSFSGSCHCGAVRFRCQIDPAQATSRCNCSICSKTRLWKSPPLSANEFTLVQGSSSLTEYRFASRRVAHMFCNHCGIKVFGHGGADAFPDEFYVVNVACLDGVSDECRAGLPVLFQDGRHDDWAATPETTAFL
jgi:hypothetical protein